ncbi:lycopene cyclase family protein [Pontibacter sp. G13]|uniref:lycopene cyclase family protein n=1 Tax=Pontibacter sp. G13 TaxID=3074898 RepID=UPI00288C0997|nr:lycopene cyclase family protein [Pontibacter sp. G13]WNJ18385.1 lycopene cyclase family protein [Pontibacter sp. G13]
MTYDYLIAGAGAAGLSLLTYLLEEPALADKQILLIDRDQKRTNDRTWCFWQEADGPFESVVLRKWDHLYFHSPKMDKLMNISPYSYKMIRGLDFYAYCFELIADHPNVTFIQDEIRSMEDNRVICENGTYEARLIFNSAQYKINPKPHQHFLKQHFKGWFLKTEKPSFVVDEPVLMDFRVKQVDGCSFVYVLPLSETEALVEYTLFSPTVLEQPVYDDLLRDYIDQYLQLEEYTIEEEEFGVIPMTNAHLPMRKGAHIVNIGTAGGYSKPSTGYTFTFIQKFVQTIVQNLATGHDPLFGLEGSRAKYHFYDSVLLRVLKERELEAWRVFDAMFANLPEWMVLRFLDEDTHFGQEILVMNSVPLWTFLKAALTELPTALFAERS